MTSRLPIFVAASLAVHGAALALWQPADTALPLSATAVEILLADTPERPAAPAEAIRPRPAAPSVADPPPITGTAPLAVGTMPVIAAPAAAPSTPDAASPTDMHDRVYATLSGAMARHFHYPPLARHRGWQGSVRLGVYVEPDGQLRDIRILDSSGYRVLDRAALHSLHQVARLPAVAGWRIASGFAMVVPVEYRLIDS